MILRVWGRERKLQEMQYRAETLFFVSHHPSSTVIFFAQHQFNHLNFDSFLTQRWLIIDSILNLCPLNLFVCKYIFSGEKQNQLLILGHQRVFWRQNHQGLYWYTISYYLILLISHENECWVSVCSRKTFQNLSSFGNDIMTSLDPSSSKYNK